MSNPNTKDAAASKLREGRYCERNPGGVSFTFNNSAARISLQSKLATMTKTGMSKHAGFCHGGRYKTRTCDLPHVKRMRYQLRQSSDSLSAWSLYILDAEKSRTFFYFLYQRDAGLPARVPFSLSARCRSVRAGFSDSARAGAPRPVEKFFRREIGFYLT